ncbi:hypothetical protein B0H19DRAFT_1065205 [Mycena capillaripes]|nr:hypothetical protein B0H19DRAFT_1065205 [Mycena capillaripes]
MTSSIFGNVRIRKDATYAPGAHGEIQKRNWLGVMHPQRESISRNIARNEVDPADGVVLVLHPPFNVKKMRKNRIPERFQRSKESTTMKEDKWNHWTRGAYLSSNTTKSDSTRGRRRAHSYWIQKELSYFDTGRKKNCLRDLGQRIIREQAHELARARRPGPGGIQCGTGGCFRDPSKSRKRSLVAFGSVALVLSNKKEELLVKFQDRYDPTKSGILVFPSQYKGRKNVGQRLSIE